MPEKILADQKKPVSFRDLPGFLFCRDGAGEHKHRQKKREREMEAIIQALEDYREPRPEGGLPVQILEFGSGEGFQIPYLQRLGHVSALDLHLSDAVRAIDGIDAYESCITQTPFQSDHFDLIFSNHVLEHIWDLPAAFRELRRIGKQDCIYAFAVPTSVWLLLSIPAQYVNKFKLIFRKFFSLQGGRGTNGCSLPIHQKCEDDPQGRRSLFDFLGLHGHGIQRSFLECYRSFKTENWAKTLVSGGFSVRKIKPLLLYGPSEFPIVPTTRAFNRWGLVSSVLFILRKV